MSTSETPQGRWLTRADAAAYLRDKHGQRCAEQTLARKACEGTGPVFHKRGRAVSYYTNDLDAYANADLSGPLRSTSDPGNLPAPAAA